MKAFNWSTYHKEYRERNKEKIKRKNASLYAKEKKY